MLLYVNSIVSTNVTTNPSATVPLPSVRETNNTNTFDMGLHLRLVFCVCIFLCLHTFHDCVDNVGDKCKTDDDCRGPHVYCVKNKADKPFYETCGQRGKKDATATAVDAMVERIDQEIRDTW